MYVFGFLMIVVLCVILGIGLLFARKQKNQEQDPTDASIIDVKAIDVEPIKDPVSTNRSLEP